MSTKNKEFIILAIDDQKDNLLTYKAIISSKMPGCRFITANSGKEGIKVATKKLPDVILLDIIMPGMDGFETCRVLKSSKVTSFIPIIMITAIKTDQSNKIKALETGADVFITKPIDTVEFIAQIKVMLRIKEAEDKIREETKLLSAEVSSKSEQLKKTSETYNLLYQISGDGVITVNKKLIITGVNNAFLETSGLNYEEVVGKNAIPFARKYLKGKSLKSMIKIIDNIFSSKKQSPFEIEYNNKILQITYSYTSGNDIIGVVRDITELKHTIEALKHNEMYFRTLIENSSDVVSILDINGNIIYESPSHKSVLGYDEDELIGRNSFELVHPDDISLITAQFNKLLINPGGIENVSFRFKNKKGDWLHLEGTGKNLVNSKHINGIVINYRDITEKIKAQNELKKNEKLLKKISENYPNSYLAIINKDMIIEYTSGSEFKKQNLDPNYILGHSAKQILGENSQEIIDYFESTFNGNEEYFELSFNNEHLYFSSVPLNDDKGNITKILVVAENITTRLQTELALEQSQARFEKLFNNIADAVFVTIIEGKERGRILEVNRAAITQTGYSREQLLNMNIIDDLSIPGTTKLNSKDWYNRLKSGNYITLTEKKLNSSGKEYWTEVMVSAIEYNGYKACLSVNRDITERKKIENDLLENQTILNAILESTGEGIVVLDNRENITHCNNEFLKILKTDKINPESSVLTIQSLMEKIKNIEIFVEKNKELAKRHESGKDIVNFLNGKVFERKNHPLILDDKVEGRVWSFNDITENKKRELIQNVLYNISNTSHILGDLHDHISIIQEELGKIIDTKNMYIAIYDESNHSFSFPFFSDEKKLSKISGNNKILTQYVVLQESPLLVNPKTRNKFIEKGILKNTDNLSKVWLGVPLKEKKSTFGVLALQSYTNESAYDEYDMKLLEFVSEQISLSILKKSTEEKLIVALSHAEESDRLKSAFLANMSHEIRTPMNGILGFASLLKADDLTKDQMTRYVQIIEKSGIRMLNIINNLIDISKIEAGQMEKKITKCNVHEQLEYLYSFFSVEANSKGLDLILHNTKLDKELFIKTDCEKLYAILANLIKNAVKYTNFGQVEFGYNYFGNQIEYFVKDTGIGIPKERHKAVFERFIQADIEDKKAMEGAGLGLAITKAYVDMLDGTIKLSSEENKGSIFTVTIPTGISNIPSLKQKSIKVEQNILKTDNKQQKILIAENEEFAAKYLKIILKDQDYELLFATDGQEAIDIFKKFNDIVLILMDIKMPVLNGYDAVKEIKKLNCEVKIIAQTSYALPGDKEKILSSGFDDYLSKPVDKDQLLSKMKRLIG